MAKKRKNYNNYSNKNTKMRLDRIAEKLDVPIEFIISYAESNGMKLYNLPPKGAKKDRLFVSIQNGNKIKKYFG